jgi:hypothetical protein
VNETDPKNEAADLPKCIFQERHYGATILVACVGQC